jgi:hypothetical protein
MKRDITEPFAPMPPTAGRIEILGARAVNLLCARIPAPDNGEFTSPGCPAALLMDAVPEIGHDNGGHGGRFN